MTGTDSRQTPVAWLTAVALEAAYAGPAHTLIVLIAAL